MDKNQIREFFDSLAPMWDADMIRDEAVIETILDNARVTPGVRVLDVACGTGVLIGDYLRRGAAHVTGIDLSPAMIAAARPKFPEQTVTLVCGDVETARFSEPFDRVIVYNAFPHFPQPARLIECLAGLVRRGGVLSVAHGMSREAINRHHEGKASPVSMGLLSAEELSALFAPYFDVYVTISDERMYQVAGIRR